MSWWQVFIHRGIGSDPLYAQWTAGVTFVILPIRGQHFKINGIRVVHSFQTAKRGLRSGNANTIGIQIKM
jgi:hypothetical protein